jgi:hypothetical protein
MCSPALFQPQLQSQSRELSPPAMPLSVRDGPAILQRSTDRATLNAVSLQSDATLMFVSSTSSIGGFSPKPHGFGLFSVGKTH